MTKELDREITFILEPDRGRCTIESSTAGSVIDIELRNDLGPGTAVNCGRPNPELAAARSAETTIEPAGCGRPAGGLYVFRIYHRSTVDGPGRRSVVQLAGCSIRCPGCYVPETHHRENGKLIPLSRIVAEVEKRRLEHDGVTILGGEPFDQPAALGGLVERLSRRGFHLTIYTGFTLESLLARNSATIRKILRRTDLLIDGPFRKESAQGAGEYRGSSNQTMIFQSILRQKMDSR